MQKSDSEIVLKKAVAEDVDTYLSIEKKVGSRIYFPMDSKKDFFEAMEKRRIYFIENQGEIVGHISYESRKDGSIYFNGFAILPEHQGRGFGRKAVDLIRGEVERAPRIDLVTHPDNFKAIELYQSLDFKIIERKENYFGDGEPRVIMVRESRP